MDGRSSSNGWLEWRRLLAPLLAAALLVVSLTICIFIAELERPKPQHAIVQLTSVPEIVAVSPITRDPLFKMGLRYWGISTPGEESIPIYLDGSWVAYSEDTAGGFSYSSIIQGCKPYNWGCGNYIFKPVKASEKLYLTLRLVKDVVDVYREEGFAGALVDLWFTDYRGNALVIDLYVTRDFSPEHGRIESVERGFVYAFTSEMDQGHVYHFNYVLAEAKDGEEVYFRRLSLEPIIDMAFKQFKLNREDWWLVSVDAGAEAHYSKLVVYLYELEVGLIEE